MKLIWYDYGIFSVIPYLKIMTLKTRKLLNYSKYEITLVNFKFIVMTTVALESISVFFGLVRGETQERETI